METKKALEKEEKELKELFKATMTTPANIFGSVVISCSERAKTNFNLKDFEKSYGDEITKEFKSKTHYTRLSVARTKKSA